MLCRRSLSKAGRPKPYSVVFADSGAMTDFAEWKTATASTLAQAKASRAEVWKAAGLDTAISLSHGAMPDGPASHACG